MDSLAAGLVMLGLLGLAVAIGLPALAIGAWVRASRTREELRRRTDLLESRVDSLRVEVRSLREAVRKGEPVVAAEAQPAATEPAPKTETAAPEAATESTKPAPLEAIPLVPAVAVPATAPPLPGPEPPATAQVASPADAARPTRLEETVSLIWFARVGALLLLLGGAWFFRYAVDNDWIGPLGRVLLGAAIGVGLVALGERLRTRVQTPWFQAVLGAGLALLYVSAYAAHGFYHLVPVGAAFAAFAVVSLFGGALAVRHRAEPVLVLALAGGLLAPVLLSTGVDRPAALFSYVLVLTSLALAVSVYMDFRFAAWTCVGGTAALFAGWYDRFFEVGAPLVLPDGSTVPAGPYHALGARAVPLGFAAAFAVQWAVAWHEARRRGADALAPLALLVAALLGAHAASAALLHDHEALLGIVLAVLAALSSALLGREKKPELLALPLAVSFAVLAAVVRQASPEAPTRMTAILALWSGAYALAVLRRPDRAPDLGPRVLAMLGGAGLAFVVLAGMLLLPANARFFAGLVAAVSLLYAALAAVSGAAAVLVLSAGLSFVAMALAVEHATKGDAPMLAAGALWAAAYVFSGARAAILRRRSPGTAALGVVSGAGLGYLVLAFGATDDSLARAALCAAVGAIDLALGVRLLAPARRDATVLLGQALGLFAGAAALLLSGATVTVVWAALAATVAVLASREKDPVWLAGAGMLFAAALLRLLSVDLGEPDRLRALFLATDGAQGALFATPILNARSFAFAECAAALFAAARAAGRSGERLFSVAAASAIAVAHALMVSLVALEVRALVLGAGSPAARPDGMPDFVQAFAAQEAQRRGSLQLATTLVFGFYAALLVCAGFALRSRLHRWMGLVLFALTVAKLALWDIWNLERVLQIAVLVGVGALLLAASYLYARRGRDGRGSPWTGPVVVLLTSAAARAGALEPGRFAWTRSIEGVDAPGLFRMEVDAAQYGLSREGLPDLRIADPWGAEVPYVLRDVPAGPPPVERLGRLLDPVTLPDGSARATADLGRPGLGHSEVVLSIEGADFLRRTRVEVSDDGRSWALLARGGHVFRVGGDAPAERTAVSYPASDARYVRVTLEGGPGAAARPVRVTGVQARLVPPGSPQPVRALELRVVSSETVAERRATRVEFECESPRVPVHALLLQVSRPAQFERRVTVQASDDGRRWVSAGGGLVYRVAPGEENLRVDLHARGHRRLRAEIDDGDAPPLSVVAAQAEYRPQELLFRAETAGTHMLCAGDPDLAAPRYDLAQVLARTGDAPVAAARLGAVRENPAHIRTQPPQPPPPPFTERHRGALGVALGLVVAGLAAWTLVLLRNAPRK